MTFTKTSFTNWKCNLGVTALILLSVSQLRAQAQAAHPYQDEHQPVAVRVADLISRMTLEEKIAQLQNGAPAIDRLGVPSYDWWNEALHGVARSGYATVFPQAIGLAATWDTHLLGQVATTISTEARAKNSRALREGNHNIYYGLTFWSPNINIFRDPRWGRGQETYGEDPYLTGSLAVAFVKGMQGDDPKYLKAVATPKHFAVHSGPESSRHSIDVPVSAHDLEDTYLPAFRAAVVDAHAESVMCAYNSLNGAPACANTDLLQQHLRKDWGFTGYVTSDCGAIDDFSQANGHHFSVDEAHASAAGLKAGTDIDCGSEYARSLKEAVDQGLLDVKTIDIALTRLFTARFRLGMFDKPANVAYARIPFSAVDSAANRKLALEAARKSMVLLKNNGILPLHITGETVAIIGPNADSLAAIEGNYNGTPSHPSLPIDALVKTFPTAKFISAQGTPYAPGLFVQVPRMAFHVAGTGSRQGLLAEYYATVGFEGKPALTRIDPQIDFDWRGAAPGAGLKSTGFAVRWTGTITAAAAGDIPVSMGLAPCYPCFDHESYRLMFDGKQVSSAETSETDRSRPDNLGTFNLHFPDTQPHQLQVEYIHRAKLFGAGLTMNWIPDADALRSEALNVASKADVVIALIGLSPNLEGEEMSVKVDGFEGGDRTKITLPTIQGKLLDALFALHKPVVVVLLNGSALAVPSAERNAAAILEAWYPGEAGGQAIADTLAGINNPAGRLPVTFYRSEDQLPPFSEYSMTNRTYRYFTGAPLYPFGFGLSYSTFRYSHLKLSKTAVKAGDPIEVDADVTNTSTIPGEEVAELYLRPPVLTTNPVLTLQSFTRVSLRPGETRHLHFHLSDRQLSTVDAEGIRSVMPGVYQLYLGGSLPTPSTPGISFTILDAGKRAILQP